MIGNSPSCFPRRARLRTTAEFQAVFTAGKRFSTPCLRVHVLANVQAGAAARLGIAVSKRVDKQAPGRNRIKRQLRECFRQQCAAVKGFDLVFVAKPAAAAANNQTLRQEIDSLLRSACALPLADAGGTMPALEATDPRRHPSIPDPS